MQHQHSTRSSLLHECKPGSSDTLRLEVHRLVPDNEQAHAGPHGHRCLGLLYLEQGGGLYRKGTNRWETEAGDLYLIAPREIHDLSQLEDAVGWGVLFSTDALGQRRADENTLLLWQSNPLFSLFLRSNGVVASRFQVAVEDRSGWSGRFEAMDKEIQMQNVGYQQVVQAYLTLILIDIVRLVTGVGEALRLQKEPLLAEVLQVLERHYAEPISLREVAAAVGFSPSYLTTLMRERTGRTVGEWLVEYRMEEARRLLIETDRSVEDISQRIGYRDPDYFIRLFRRTHGTTPLRWRRIARDG